MLDYATIQNRKGRFDNTTMIVLDVLICRRVRWAIRK